MRFSADFQSMDSARQLELTFDDILDAEGGAVAVGNLVVLDDLEGNSAVGAVTGVENGVIDVRVDLLSWKSSHVGWNQGWASGQPRIVPSAA